MICLTTPFSGRDFCFEEYCDGIKKLQWDRNDISYLAYDNSNNEKFGKKIDAFAESCKFGSYKRVVDSTPVFVANRKKDYSRDLMNRLEDMYQSLFSSVKDCEYVFNVEDDVQIQPDSLLKLMDIHNKYENVGTAVSCCMQRKLADNFYERLLPMAWKFKRDAIYPYSSIEGNVGNPVVQIVNAPPFGIEIIGAAHMSCWLTDMNTMNTVPFKNVRPIIGVDISWGYNLIENGKHTVIDWSIKTKHYSNVDYKKEFVQ